jgi:acetyltransferase
MNLNILHPVRERKNNAPNFAAKPHDFDANHTLFMKELGRVKLRLITVADEAEMIQFHEDLSEESIYLRYFEHISLDTRTLHERLAKVCANTADSVAIVAETYETSHSEAQILAVGRLTTTEKPDVAAFATIVADKAQITGLPRELLQNLLTVARAYGFKSVTGELLVADHDALNICRSLGFNLHTVPEDGIVRVQCSL